MAVPTPFLVGRVNCYLIEDDPLTLVDTGPNSGKSLDELEQALAQLGHRIEDLGLIVITHQHMDHLGPAGDHRPALGGRGGGAGRARALPGGLQRQRRRRRRVLDDGDAPPRRPRRAGHRPAASVGARVPRLRLQRSGDGAAARGHRAHARATARSPPCTAPGTAPRTRCSGTRSARSSSPAITCCRASRPTRSSPGRSTEPAAGAAAEDRPHALVRYMESLRETREMPARLVLGGHGPPVTEHAALIDERFRMTDAPGGQDPPPAGRRSPDRL